MRRQDDNAYLEAALRRSLPRRAAPSSLRARVLSEIRNERDLESERTLRGRFPWRMHWAIGTCATAAVVALVWLTLPLRQDPSDVDAVAMESADRQLAEVLQLAGSKWNRAQEIALSPIQENGND